MVQHRGAAQRTFCISFGSLLQAASSTRSATQRRAGLKTRTEPAIARLPMATAASALRVFAWLCDAASVTSSPLAAAASSTGLTMMLQEQGRAASGL